MSVFERLLEPGCTEGLACRCGEEMEVASHFMVTRTAMIDADVRVPAFGKSLDAQGH